MSTDRISGTNTVAQNMEIASQDGNISSDEIREIVSAARENGVTGTEVNAARAWLNRSSADMARGVAASHPEASAADVRQATNETLTSMGITNAVGIIEHQLGEDRQAQGTWVGIRARWAELTSTINN